MIEVTSVTVDGITHPESFRILEPDIIWHGVGVHYVSKRLIAQSDIDKSLRELGMKRVSYDDSMRSFLYAQKYPAYLAISLEFLSRINAKIVWWLYIHGRMFQEIPPQLCFSWRYFTPYFYTARIYRWLKQQLKLRLSVR